MQKMNTTVSFQCIPFDSQKTCLCQIPTFPQLSLQAVSGSVDYCRILYTRLYYKPVLYSSEGEQSLPVCKKIIFFSLVQCSYPSPIHPNIEQFTLLNILWASLSGIDFSHFDTPPDENALPSHSLDNKTPSEVAGINLGLENKKNRRVGLISKALCPDTPTGVKNVP